MLRSTKARLADARHEGPTYSTVAARLPGLDLGSCGCDLEEARLMQSMGEVNDESFLLYVRQPGRTRSEGLQSRECKSKATEA